MIKIKDGVFYKDNKPNVMISADYPYYRDDPDNWENRLDLLKAAGIEVISFYVPWRHHHLIQDGEQLLDFLGSTQGNRNVLRFLKLIKEKSMFAIVKPGPFIHAETNFGGLPDFVEGGSLGEAMLDNEGNPRTWQKKLPAPFDEKFNQAVKSWFKVVDDTLVKPYTYPEGPVIFLQILNEGLYSDGQHSVLDYDYSESGINYHIRRLNEQYGDISSYNKSLNTNYDSYDKLPIPREYNLNSLTDKKQLLPYLHWAETQNRYLGELYSKWGEEFDTVLPIVNNLNPPWPDKKGFDFWLTRVVPEHWNVSYGFTNWIGVVSHDKSAFLRYLLLVKRDRGMNLEENWGFSKLYDWRYRFHFIPFYQTVLAMGLGATGFNVYTGVSTDQWTDELDNVHERPYPDVSPISEKGETGEKYQALKILVEYLKKNEALLLEGKVPNEATWALYPPYSYLSSYSLKNEDYALLGEKAPRSGRGGLESFMLTMLEDNREFGMVNIETDSVEKLEKEKVLVLAGGFFMHRHVQEKLVEYVKRGGILLLFGGVPELDESMENYSPLASLIETSQYPNRITHGEGIIRYHPENPFESGEIASDFSNLLTEETEPQRIKAAHAYTFYYEKPDAEESMLYVLSSAEKSERHEINVNGEVLTVDLPKKGCGIFTFKQNRIASCVVKGINDYDESYVAPYVKYGDSEISYDIPCDLYYQEEDEKYVTTNQH